jgi:hypothetical protein
VIWFQAPGASSAGQAVSADRAIGVSYQITQDSQQEIHGQIVVANNGSSPVTGWRIRVVLPGDTHYQVLGAGNHSAGDALIVAPQEGQALAGGRSELVTFTARGATSAPVRAAFTEAARTRQAAGPGPAAATGPAASTGASRPRSGPHGHDGWPGGWLGSWLAGWPDGSWPGRDGQHHGWPGGR